MKSLRTIASVVAALAAVDMAALVDARADSSSTYYALSAPRVIVVPQPGDDLRRTQASLNGVAPEIAEDDDDDLIAPPSRPHRAAKPEPRVRKSAARQPPKAVTQKEPVRRKPFSVSLPEPRPEPEPAGPRRALLSAPPPVSSIHDGPTPLRPTPRFGQSLPEPPPLTTLTPPPMPAPAAKPVAAAAPAVEFTPPAPAFSLPADDNDDQLPPPGDPKLAPPEPRD